MKTNISFIVVLSAMGLCGCLSQKYLPRPDKMGSNPYGAYIRVTLDSEYLIDGKLHDGELIAVDSNSLFVLTRSDQKVKQFSIAQGTRYKLYVASTDHNMWIPFVFALTSISHGAFGLLTLPINLPTSIILATGGYTLRQHEITPDQLRRFCRYPQGLPPNLPLSEIK